MNKLALIAAFTAALLTSGCFIERTVPVAVYPEPSYEDDYYASSYDSSYDSAYAYGDVLPSPRPSQPLADRNNRQPILQGLNANPGFAVAPGQTITFTVSAHDPDRDPLQYTWSATGGMLSADSGQMVGWMPPAERGIYTIQVLITDGRGGTVKGSQNILVDDRGAAQAVSRPAPQPSATFEPVPTLTPQPSPRPTPTPRPIMTTTPFPVPTPTPVASPSPTFEEWVTHDEEDETEL